MNRQRRSGKKWSKCRDRVHVRDGERCRIRGCGMTQYLRVAHIKPWAHYPELRFDLDNLLLLCGIHDAQYGDRLEEVRHLWYNTGIKTKAKFRRIAKV